MTLKEKVNKFEYLQEVWVLDGKDIVNGLYVGYCGDIDQYSVYFGYNDDSYTDHFDISVVFATREEADKESAVRIIKQLENQIDAIKKEYNL